MRKLSFITLALIAMLTTGCVQNSKAHIMSAQGSVQLRSYQTKVYDVKCKKDLMRATVAVLQDLSFIVDKADAELGTITATKLDGYHMKMTITIRQKAKQKYAIRSNIQYQDQAIEEPKPYQDFYASLDKALFLQKNKVD